MPIAIRPAPIRRTTMTAVGGSVTPSTRPLPTASETFAPWVAAPTKPRIPTTKAARIVEMALAPTAGAKGVAPLEPAPMTQAMKRLASAATPNRRTVAGSIYRITYRKCKRVWFEPWCSVGRGGRGVGVLGSAAPDALEVRAGEHADERPQNGDVADTDAGVGRAGTDAREAPADAEDRPADQHVAIEGLQAAFVDVARHR